jgi:exopolysaccharide production protein ExoY
MPLDSSADLTRGIAPLSQGRERDARSSSESKQVQVAIVVGTARDVPRALEHPAVVSGERFTAAHVMVVPDEPERADRTLIAELEASIERHGATVLLLAGPVGRPIVSALADLSLMRDIRLLAVMPTELVSGHEPAVIWEGDSPLVRVARLPHPRWALALKRAVDVVVSAVALVVLSPVLLGLMLAIRIESPGSPVFRHLRVGRGGRSFWCLKLRTMRADAEAVLRSDAALLDEYRRNHYKLPDGNDPRVTSLGRFLRRTSLDELPQLWNVLRGEMSLVGPRPVIGEELRQFGDHARLVLSVSPGLTGAWAVNGRHHVGYPERASLEIEYVRSWTLGTDARILFRTISAVLDPGAEPRVPTSTG